MFLVPLSDKTTVNLDKLMKFQDGDRNLSLVANKIFRVAEDHQHRIIQALENDINTNSKTTWVKFDSGVMSVYINNSYLVEVRDFLKYTQIALTDTVIQLREYAQRDQAMKFYRLVEPMPVPKGVTVLFMDELQEIVENMPVEVLSDAQVVEEAPKTVSKLKATPKAKTTSTIKNKTGKEKA